MIYTYYDVDEALCREVEGFLSGVPDGCGVCFEHQPRWLRVLQEGLGHTTLALVARADGPHSPIRGYLPLALVRSTLFGRFLVSLPYVNRAGIVATDDGVRRALFTEAATLARQHAVQYLELRHHERRLDDHAITHNRDDKALMVLGLPRTDDALWTGLDAKVRNQVRKGQKCGLAIRWGGAGLLDDFYAIFSENMRDLGTPVYPRQLFASILDRFDDEAELAVVDHAGSPVAAALLIHDATRQTRTTQVPSASSRRAANPTSANMWMYHELLKRAIQRGSHAFDFGRSSPDSGTYRFKKQWGAAPQPTVWQYHVLRGEPSAMRPEDPKMQRRIQQWQRLPLWVTRLVGPAIVRGIP